MTNTLASMIQREQDTDPEKRNALASDINWVTPNVGQVAPKWVSTSDAPWIERAYRDAKDIGDVVARGALDLPNKLMMAVTDREAPAWALRNLTPAGQMVQGANQFAAGLRGTEVAENIWDQPEPLADAPWLQRVGNMATGISNMALAYAPMEKAVGGAVGSIGAKVANKWPMQKGIYVGPKSKAWTARPQVGTEGETVPEGAFSSLYDRKPRVEIDDSGAVLATPKTDRETFLRMVDPGTTLDESLQHPELFAEYPQLKVTPTSAMDAYRNLAGEIEARDAAARANMTMAERRATPPYSSENIPVNEAIVRFDRNGPQAMVRPGEGGQIEGYVEGPERDANFKKWFGDSKVVDENGEPMVFYHGTTKNFKMFDPNKIGSANDEGWYGRAFYFTDDSSIADNYASNRYYGGTTNGSSIYPVFLRLKNPLNLSMDSKMDSSFVRRLKKIRTSLEAKKSKGIVEDPLLDEDILTGEKVHKEDIDIDNENKRGTDVQALSGYNPAVITQAAIEHGYDGIMNEFGEYAVFSPTQIKSKFNRGTFDPKDPRILYGAGAGLAAYSATQDNKDVSDAPWLSNK